MGDQNRFNDFSGVLAEIVLRKQTFLPNSDFWENDAY